MTATHPLFRGWIVVGWTAILMTVIVGGLLAAQGFTEAGLHLIIRTTAQTSFLLFLAAFSASALHSQWPAPSTKWLRANRRYVGVSFAVSHTYHLAAIISLAIITKGEAMANTSTVTLVAGAIGYIFLAAMVATSFDQTARRLGARAWRRLHTTGMYYLWGVFMFSYGGRAAVSLKYLPLALLLIAALALRVIARKTPEKKALAAGQGLN